MALGAGHACIRPAAYGPHGYTPTAATSYRQLLGTASTVNTDLCVTAARPSARANGSSGPIRAAPSLTSKDATWEIRADRAVSASSRVVRIKECSGRKKIRVVGFPEGLDYRKCREVCRGLGRCA